MDEELRRIFANNLKFALKMTKRTQKELAEYLGVSTATVSDWVNGKKIPRTDKLQSISNWLNIDLPKLLYEYENPPKPVRLFSIAFPHSAKVEELITIVETLPENDIDVLIAYAKRLADSLK